VIFLYLSAGGALADPKRPGGQQKCPQMGCLGLGQADRKTKRGDSSWLCDQHDKCGIVRLHSNRKEEKRQVTVQQKSSKYHLDQFSHTSFWALFSLEMANERYIGKEGEVKLDLFKGDLLCKMHFMMSFIHKYVSLVCQGTHKVSENKTLSLFLRTHI